MTLSNTWNDIIARIAFYSSVRRRLTLRDLEMPLRNAVYRTTMRDCKLQDQIHTNAEVGIHEICKWQSSLSIRPNTEVVRL